MEIIKTTEVTLSEWIDLEALLEALRKAGHVVSAPGSN
jgi:hypothetical protein